ncbi:MAG: DUF488 family protein [Gammaproteobacteria bacterium]
MTGHKTPIYTIGYGDRGFSDFVRLLDQYSVRYVLDVRSSPFSKYQTDFTRDRLKALLRSQGITCGFFGDLMGGRSNNPACYVDGIVYYDACRETSDFKQGVARFVEAVTKGHVVALMCSELKPQDCHRSKMIGVGLDAVGLAVIHIDENGKPKSQSDVMSCIAAKQLDLFSGTAAAGLTSRKKYTLRGYDDYNDC